MTGAAHERHTTFLNTHHMHKHAVEAPVAAQGTTATGNADAPPTVNRLAAMGYKGNKAPPFASNLGDTILT